MNGHHSFQGYGPSDRGDRTQSCSKQPPLRYSQETSGNNTAAIYPDSSSATAPPNNNSNHVTSLHDATLPLSLSNLADRSGTASNVTDFSKVHPSLLTQLPPPPPPLPIPSIPYTDMGYQPGAHDSRLYSYGVGYDAVPQASSSQYTLDAFPAHYTHPSGIISYSRYTSVGDQHDGGVPSREIVDDYIFDDEEYEEDAEAEGTNYATSDVDMDTYHQQFSPMDEFHISSDPSQRVTPMSEPEWYGNSEDSPNSWANSMMNEGHQRQLVGMKQHPYVPQTRQAGSCFVVLNPQYPIPPTFTQGQQPFANGACISSSSHTSFAPYSEPYLQDARNTPSDISSSASPLSPIESTSYPASHFAHIASSSSTALAPQSYGYPYSSAMMGAYAYDGIASGETYMSTAVPSKMENPCSIAVAPPPEPFISTLLNQSRIPPDPVLHAPKPIRPIPTVSFEDLAATVSATCEF
ncbi:hypothetical protein VNI00_002279 [Paramarasmius palmivorus]|uniref:Uncharacterized protein n=1 Tax=Paramarasmius palmivorus TaxID=297713 RepID=A0AAW0E170_9AGAR